MALSRTNLLGQITAGDFGSGTFTTTAFTPPNNSLLVVGADAIEDGGSTDPTTLFVLTDSAGLTWTERIARSVSPTSFGTFVKIWTAPVTTGVSMTLSLDMGARAVNHYGVSVVAYTGHNTSSPTGATADGGQVGGFSGPPDPASITLSGAPATTSEVFAVVGVDKSLAGTAPGSGWTELHDLFPASGTPFGGMQSQVRAGSASTTVAWADVRGTAGGNLFNWAAVALEIKESAAPSVDLTGTLTLPALDMTGSGGPATTVTGTLTLPALTMGGTLAEEEEDAASSIASGGWSSLLGIVRQARADYAEDKAAPPVACPHDGEPLTHVRGVRHCRYCGWTWRS